MPIIKNISNTEIIYTAKEIKDLILQDIITKYATAKVGINNFDPNRDKFELTFSIYTPWDENDPEPVSLTGAIVNLKIQN